MSTKLTMGMIVLDACLAADQASTKSVNERTNNGGAYSEDSCTSNLDSNHKYQDNHTENIFYSKVKSTGRECD
jgi:hypothetical protein